MRKILYSPGYGAGWSSWNSNEIARYLLTYKPIIDFIEAGGKFEEKDISCKCSKHHYITRKKSTVCTKHPLLLQLEKEVLEMFGESYVCLLGARDLEVMEVSGRIRVNEYDGYESIEEEGEYSDWM